MGYLTKTGLTEPHTAVHRNYPLLTLTEAEDNLQRRRSFGSLRFSPLVSADVRGAGTRYEPLRRYAWEATLKIACFILVSFTFSKVSLQLIKENNEMRQELD